MELIITEVGPKIPTICVSMIVKNESNIIIRCLDSVLPIIDTYCICDTGSTDDTIEKIETYFHKKSIQGKIIQEPFQDFGYNRTFALKAAKKMADYLLFIDADMILTIDPSFNKKDLTGNAYSFSQGSSTFQYSNLRLIHTSLNIECVGATHEYYNHNGNVQQLVTLWIKDIGDGGAKDDKFSRDLRLLLEDLQKNAENPRTHFYLGNTYRALGNPQEAIKHYEKRINIGGWVEEVWYSYHSIGLCYQGMNEIEKAIYWWLKAYNFYPTRSENIYEIVKHYRILGDQRSSYLFYTIGHQIPYPSHDNLFIQKDVYDYLLDYEYSVIAYYIDQSKERVRKVYMKLFNIHHQLDHNNIISNYKFYARSLVNISNQTIDLAPLVLHYPKNCGYIASSPSITPFQDGYILNIRFVNYHIDTNGKYSYHNGYNVQTNNIYMLMDRECNQHRQNIWNNDFIDSCRIQGLEDVKIIYHCGILYFLATKEVAEKLADDNTNMVMIHGLYDLSKNSLDYTEIKSPFQKTCEKNWVFFSHGDDLRVIYKWHPLTIGSIKEDQFVIEQEQEMPPIFKYMRGSTNGYLYEGELWFVAHIVDYSTPRHYYHCLVILDAKTLAYKYHSELFTFQGEKIEYCLGLVVEKERILMTYSCWDRTAILAVYDKATLMQAIFGVCKEFNL